MEKDAALVVFQDKKIRRVWHKNEWFFSVIDVVSALEASNLPRRYWSDLKAKLAEEGFEPYDKIVQLKLSAEDGKLRETDCANTKNMFRIIQSIPSPKAEPFKQWLAQVGYERVEEIQNPELAQVRMKELYRAKGYSDEWIEKRVRGIAVRQELTDEWKDRAVREDTEFAILTNEISKATFMNDLELIFTMLGERVTTEITRVKEAKGFDECKGAAKEGGDVAGNARKDTERRIGKPITTGENYLATPEKEKRKQLKKPRPKQKSI